MLMSGVATAQGMDTLLFEDTFEHGLGGWTTQTNTWTHDAGSITSHPLYVAELTGGHPDWQDVRIESEVELLEDLGFSGAVHVLFRWQGQWQGYGLVFKQGGTELVRFEGGARQYQTLTRTDRTLTTGSTNRVRIDVQGRRMTVFLDDAPVLQAMDPVNTHRSGRVGLRTDSASVRISRFTVTGPADAPVIDIDWLSRQTELDRILGGFPATELVGPGYHPPGTEAAAGAENIALIYTHAKTWNTVDALPYVGYGELVREIGSLPRMEWRDWFFDTFLFLSLFTGSGEAFDSASRAAPANWNDWVAFIDQLFAKDAQFAAFDQAVAQVKRALGEDDHRAKVIVMIPYPDVAQTNFGDPTALGRSLNFSTQSETEVNEPSDRLIAVRAFVDTFLHEWERHDFEHLELVGFYWLAELVHNVPGEEELIRATADHIHSEGHRFYWIPYYSAAGYEKWQELGFDVAILQPNYMFNTRLPRNRLADAAREAYALGMGIEIEADGTIISSAEGRQRYRDYLWAGVKYGYMEDAVHAYYVEHDLLGRAFLSTLPDVRAVYEDTYLFVKGLFGKEESGS